MAVTLTKCPRAVITTHARSTVAHTVPTHCVTGRCAFLAATKQSAVIASKPLLAEALGFDRRRRRRRLGSVGFVLGVVVLGVVVLGVVVLGVGAQVSKDTGTMARTLVKHGLGGTDSNGAALTLEALVAATNSLHTHSMPRAAVWTHLGLACLPSETT